MIQEYYLFDGDKIGSKVNRLMLEDDDEALTSFSEILKQAIDSIALTLQNLSCKLIYVGGDSVFVLGIVKEQNLMEIIENFKNDTGVTISVGIGSSKSKCLLSLTLAKARGGNTAVRIAENNNE